MSDDRKIIELAAFISPKSLGTASPKEVKFWLDVAERAIIFHQRKGFWHGLRAALTRRPPVSSKEANDSKGTVGPLRFSGKVRLHPLPEGAPSLLSACIGAAVAGGLRDCLNAHPMPLTGQQKGLLIGSTRKRVVNQLVCKDGIAKLKQAMEGC